MVEKSEIEFQQFQALYDLGSAMSFTTLIQADKIANIALSMAIEFAGASRGFLILINEQGRSRYCFGIDTTMGTTEHRPPDQILQIMVTAREARAPVKGEMDEGARPYVCVPLIADDEVVGVLYLDRPAGGGSFEAREERLAKLAAGQLAISITARFLYEQMIEKRKQVELIDKVGKAVHSPVDLENVLSLVVETAQQAIRAESVALMLVGEGGELEVRFRAGLDSDPLDAERQPLASRLIGLAWDREAPQIHPDPGSVPDRRLGSGPDEGSVSAVAIPVKLTLRDKRIFNERRRKAYAVAFTKVLGVLYLENRSRLREFTEDDQFVLQVFADHITTAVTNDTLYRQASTDNLTGLASRRYLDLRLADELEFAARTSTPFSVVLLDIDDFKGLNDTYGHQAGDEILREVGRIFKRSVRKFDICGRYGGEEFILALPETDADGARVVAENVREKVATAPFIDEDNPVAVTVSIGVAAYPAVASDLPTLIGAADTALYQAKRAGKNRYVVAGEEG